MGLHKLVKEFTRLAIFTAFIAKRELCIRNWLVQELAQWFPAFFHIHFKKSTLIYIGPNKLIMLAVTFPEVFDKLCLAISKLSGPSSNLL